MWTVNHFVEPGLGRNPGRLGNFSEVGKILGIKM